MSRARGGSTREVSDPSCQFCGADLAGTRRVRVDDWTAFVCPECDDDPDQTAPATCVVYRLSRAEGGD